MSASVGIVGLGLVGTALAQRLLSAGFSLKGYDIRATVRTAFEALGGHWCSEVTALSDCDVLVFAVFQTADLEAVVEELIFKNQQAPKVTSLIDCSTGDPDRLQALAHRLKPKGIALLEAPLSGSSVQIANADATMLLGGDLATVDRLKPILQALCPQRIHAGAVGMGARAKLATNLVLGLNRAVLAEGMAFAQSQGIEPAAFLQMVLNSPARSDAALIKGQKMVNADFTPQSRIIQHLKDVELMLHSAEQSGQGLPLSREHARLMRDAITAGDGELDNAAIFLQIKREKPNA
jgi:3-hydroxyisobutyrate dehydrogenase-like beta-hydroxyacid dehydrogenase